MTRLLTNRRSKSNITLCSIYPCFQYTLVYNILLVTVNPFIHYTLSYNTPLYPLYPALVEELY